MSTELVKKPHFAITSIMNYTPREQDLVTLMFRGVKREYDRVVFATAKMANKSVNEISDDEVDISKVRNEFVFSIEELENSFSLSKSALYDAIESSSKGVMTKLFEAKLPHERKFRYHSICTDAVFVNGELTLTVNPKFIPHMVDYSKGYAETELKLFLSLKGGYEKKILDWISRFKNTSDYKMTLGELCSELKTDYSSYSSPAAFRRSVLDGSIKRIVEASDGIWQVKKGYPMGYEIKKTGRSYKDSDVITFKMKYNEPENDTFHHDNWTLPNMNDNLTKMIIHVTGFVTATDDEPYAELSHEYLTAFLKFAQDMEAMKEVGTDPESILKLYFSAMDKRNGISSED